mgnify:CR=1 FL=1
MKTYLKNLEFYTESENKVPPREYSYLDMILTAAKVLRENLELLHPIISDDFLLNYDRVSGDLIVKCKLLDKHDTYSCLLNGSESFSEVMNDIEYITKHFFDSCIIRSCTVKYYYPYNKTSATTRQFIKAVFDDE